ncbi:MAG TPA: alpha/beta hydrolase [Gammaproteobacteria bacterium]|nr:alpha/beta hydrolase [Gammaproteobacteria bacterium]
MPWQPIGDTRFYYELHGSGSPLVLLHGLQGDSSNFGDLVPGLALHHRVLVFDQRGSGWSDKPAGNYSMALLADDTAALMEALGLDRAHVFGVSMGGMVAQELALHHPARMRSLILGCTSACGPAGVALDGAPRDSAYELAPISGEERARRLAAAGFSAQFLREHPDMVERLAQARRRRPLDIDALARRRRALERHDTLARLDRIRVPALILRGLQDAIVAPENSRRLAARIPDARLETLSGAGHLFWMECPDQTLAHVLGFLAEHGD